MTSLERLTVIGAFIEHCLLAEGYTFPHGLADAVKLTPAGKEIVNAVSTHEPSVGEADALAAALGVCAGGDSLLVDYENTDEAEVYKLLGEEISHRRIRYPWVFGRELDKHYAAVYSNSTNLRALPPGQSFALLDGVSQGVAQIRDVVVGPLGILLSHDIRSCPPTTCGPNYQCSMLGCNSAHHLRLTTGHTPAGVFYEALGRLHPPSERMAFRRSDILRPDEKHWDWLNDGGIPWLLGNALTPTEQRALLVRLLRLDDTVSADRLKGLEVLEGFSKNGLRVADSLTDAEVLQMLLTFGTKSLVMHLECLVDDGHIHLSPSEVRVPVLQRHVDGGGFKTSLELSPAGVRFAPEARVPLLRSLLRALYADKEDELAFLLLDFPGAAFDRLDLFLRAANEQEVLRRLVLSSRATLLRAFDELRYGHFAVPGNEEQARALEQRLLWKLIGTLDAPTTPQGRLTQFGDIFRGVVAIRPEVATEEWVTAVRSAGMDFFVEVEAIVALAIDFAGWMLTCDHYNQGRDGFLYSRDRSKAWTARLLSSAEVEGFEFREGGNPMGTLIQAGPVLADLLEDIQSREAEFRRTGEPQWASHSSVLNFPFRHTRPICDISTGSAEAIFGALRGLRSEFSRADVAGTRNRLGHPPATFPSSSELNLALDGALRSVNQLAQLGLIPTIYRLHSSTVDASRRQARVMRDGSGAEITMFGPSELLMAGMPWSTPQLVIVPGVLVRDTLQPLRFKVLEDTEFAKEWRDYQGLDAVDSHGSEEQPSAGRPVG
ncbi:hypothetical protein NOCD_14320 [Nocardioides cavernae]|uniref:hypothetical protein n=1 Tax=Nocardioides TaxID=1839 RepID=UPI0012E33893|nr:MULTISPECIES: hypothetical protein [Nocardioides]MCK9824656.1 hypothetical protein [Nocardioides cavernae]